MIKKFTVACFASAALLVAGAGAASAGEITGNGKPVPAPQKAASECSYSGLNDYTEPPEIDPNPVRTQSFGQIVRAKQVAPRFFNPGDACNPHAAQPH